jgi:hypothetical protein
MAVLEFEVQRNHVLEEKMKIETNLEERRNLIQHAFF